jgi:hypothetical protein
MFNQTNLHGVAQTNFGLSSDSGGVVCVRDGVCALWVRFFRVFIGGIL